MATLKRNMDPAILQQKIYEVRGHKIILDFDLAVLYEVETRVFNQAVKRNKESFPDDFMFRLTSMVWERIITFRTVPDAGEPKLSSSQFVMMNNLPQNRSGKYLPYAFTEHGVSMVASVLKSTKARKMNIAIVRAFIALRKFATSYGELLIQIQELRQSIGNHDVQLNQIYDALENLLDEKAEQKNWRDRERIGFKPK